MKILHSFDELNINCRTAITVGKFDGLHTGHSVLLDYIAQNKTEDMVSCVITFDKNPASFVSEEKEKLIMTRSEKFALFSERGVDFVIEVPFDKNFMSLSAEAFIKLLYEKLNMSYMAVGDDFRFGYKGAGDAALLERYAEKLGFSVDVIKKIRSGERDISSTYIREEIKNGDIELANSLLGYPYYIIGNIIHGNGIGAKKIGRATINMIPSDEKLLPKCGVYITEVILEGRKYHGVSDIGFRPTIEEDIKKLGIETHILDFEHQVYDKTAKIIFYKYLREEIKFKNLDDLKKQIENDVHTTYSYFNNK